MAEQQFLGNQGAPAAAAAPVPPTFEAKMIREAPIGAIISILLGIALLYLFQWMAGPDVLNFELPNFNEWVVAAISSMDEEIGIYAGSLIMVPTLNDPNTPLSTLQVIYAAFLSFPAGLAWILGGFIVSFIRVRKGRDEGNLKGGWDTFWYGLFTVELPMLVFGAFFLIFALIPLDTATVPNIADLQGFTGSVVLFYLLFFLQPMFWLGMFCSLFGSLLGAIAAKRNVK